MPQSHVRLSAGREAMNEQMQALAFFAGANSIFYGEQLLTTVHRRRNEEKVGGTDRLNGAENLRRRNCAALPCALGRLAHQHALARGIMCNDEKVSLLTRDGDGSERSIEAARRVGDKP